MSLTSSFRLMHLPSNNDEATEQWIMDDIRKLKRYIQEGNIDAQISSIKA